MRWSDWIFGAVFVYCGASVISYLLNEHYIVILLGIMFLILAWFFYDKAVYFFLLAAPFMPLYAPGHMTDALPGASLMILLLLTVWSYRKVVEQKSMALIPLDKVVILFSGWLLVTYLVPTTNPLDSFRMLINFISNYGSLPVISLMYVVQGMAVYFLVRDGVQNKTLDKKLIVSTLVVCLILIAGYGIIESMLVDRTAFYHGRNRATSTFFDPNSYGTFLILLLPLAFALHKDESLVSKLAIILGVTGLAMTFSRGAWLGILTGGVYGGILWINRRLKLVKSARVYSLILIAVPLLLIIGFFVAAAIGDDLTVQRKLQGRWYLWNAGINMAERTPLFGVGIGRYNENLINYYDEGIEPWTKYEHAHNWYIQVGAETGVIGLSLLLLIVSLILITGFVKIQKHNERLDYLLLIGIVAVLMHSLVDYTVRQLFIIIPFWTIVALLNSPRQDKKKEKKRKK